MMLTSIIALILASLTLLGVLWLGRETLRIRQAQLRPLLQVEPIAAGKLKVDNLGPGPAYRVMLARQEQEEWRPYTAIELLRPGESLEIPFPGEGEDWLAAVYHDYQGKVFASRFFKDRVWHDSHRRRVPWDHMNWLDFNENPTLHHHH